MTQPWRFVVITGDGIERFTTFREEEYRRKNPGEQFNQLKFDKMRAASEKCSHIILIGMKRQESRKLPEWEEVAARSVQLCRICSFVLLLMGWPATGVPDHEHRSVHAVMAGTGA